MCLRDCFEKGSCAKTLVDCEIEVVGKGEQLRYRSPGSSEFRSHYKGDAEWRRNRDGSIDVIEHHNIERICLQVLAYMGINTRLDVIGWAVRSTLKNRSIYDELVAERLKALARRGWARKTKRGVWRINPSGKVEAKKHSHIQFEFR
jgi:hypothetical protein